jgi:hypothetical protein
LVTRRKLLAQIPAAAGFSDPATSFNLVRNILFVNPNRSFKETIPRKRTFRIAATRRHVSSPEAPATLRSLTAAPERSHLRAMPAFASPLATMRRSVLGAWLAVAYALAVLAAGLAPQAAMAHPVLDGAWLCSGLAAPASDAPGLPAEADHCKACPASPAMAAPPPMQQPTLARRALPVALERPPQPGIGPATACGLPQSRAPPAV